MNADEWSLNAEISARSTGDAELHMPHSHGFALAEGLRNLVEMELSKLMK